LYRFANILRLIDSAQAVNSTRITYESGIYDQSHFNRDFLQFRISDQTRVNDPLFHSVADWISPGYDDEIFPGGRHPMAPGSPGSRCFEDAPANDGRKVVITDIDHYVPGMSDALWAWKSFLRVATTRYKSFVVPPILSL